MMAVACTEQTVCYMALFVVVCTEQTVCNMALLVVVCTEQTVCKHDFIDGSSYRTGRM